MGESDHGHDGGGCEACVGLASVRERDGTWGRWELGLRKKEKEIYADCAVLAEVSTGEFHYNSALVLWMSTGQAHSCPQDGTVEMGRGFFRLLGCMACINITARTCILSLLVGIIITNLSSATEATVRLRPPRSRTWHLRDYYAELACEEAFFSVFVGSDQTSPNDDAPEGCRSLCSF